MLANGTSTIPASAFAQWPAPNFVNPVTRDWFVPYAIVLQIISGIIFIIRMVTKVKRITGKPGPEDGIMAIAFLQGIGLSVLFITGVWRAGYDRHVWDNPPKKAPMTAFIGWLTSILFITATGLTKISTLLFYIRMCSGTSKKTFVRLNYAGIFFIVLYMVTFTVNFILICTPIDAYWKSFIPIYKVQYHCGTSNISGPVIGVLSVATDLVAAAFPVFLFYDLKVPRREKIGLWVVSGLGLLNAAVGTGRTYWLFRLSNAAPLYDLTWISYNVFVWSQTEVQLGMICASFPALKVFYAKMVKAPLSNTTRSHTHKNSTSSSNMDLIMERGNAKMMDAASEKSVKSSRSTGSGRRFALSSAAESIRSIKSAASHVLRNNSFDHSYRQKESTLPTRDTMHGRSKSKATIMTNATTIVASELSAPSSSSSSSDNKTGTTTTAANDAIPSGFGLTHPRMSVINPRMSIMERPRPPRLSRPNIPTINVQRATIRPEDLSTLHIPSPSSVNSASTRSLSSSADSASSPTTVKTSFSSTSQHKDRGKSHDHDIYDNNDDDTEPPSTSTSPSHRSIKSFRTLNSFQSVRTVGSSMFHLAKQRQARERRERERKRLTVLPELDVGKPKMSIDWIRKHPYPLSRNGSRRENRGY